MLIFPIRKHQMLRCYGVTVLRCYGVKTQCVLCLFVNMSLICSFV